MGHSNKNLPGLVVVCLMGIVCGVRGQAEAPAYAIKFVRGYQKGQAFTVTMRHAESFTQRQEGQNVQASASKTVTLEGELRIAAVDEQARETAAHLVIRRLQTQEDAAAATSVVMPGTEVDITYGPGTVAFATGGQELDAAAKTALGQFFRARREQKSTRDDLFGTKERKRVGDTWPVNAAAIAAAVGVDAGRVTGSVTLKSVKTVAGVECVTVEATVTQRDFPVAELPAGQSLKESTLTSTYSSDLPTDAARPALGWTSRSTIRLVTEQVDEGGVIRKTASKEQTDAVTLTPLR